MTMHAGAEMDARIATEVMGWHWELIRIDNRQQNPQVYGWRTTVNKGNNYRLDWHPSTNIAHAWEVVELMKARGMVPSVDTEADGQWFVCWTAADAEGVSGCGPYADTAPLAICRAALQALAPAPGERGRG